MVTQDEILNLIGSNEGIIQSKLPDMLNGEPGNINHAIMRLNKKRKLGERFMGLVGNYI